MLGVVNTLCYVVNALCEVWTITCHKCDQHAILGWANTLRLWDQFLVTRPDGYRVRRMKPSLKRTGERGGELRRVTAAQEVYEMFILVRKHEC